MSKKQNIIQNNTQSQQILKISKKFSSPIRENQFTQLAVKFDLQVKNPKLLYPLNQNYYQIEKNPIEIYTLFGASNMGRKSSIYWANRYTNYPIIKIDVNLFSTELQFIQKIANEVGRIVEGSQLKKQIVSNEQINFDAITPFIIESKKKFLILIDNAERLTQPKRQIILYTLLQWMKKDVKQYIGLYVLVKNIKFLQSLQKRVKSRYTSKYLFYNNIGKRQLIKVLINRVVYFNNLNLLELMYNFFECHEFNKIIQDRLELSSKITQFLLIVKQMLYSVDFQKFTLAKDKNKYFYEIIIHSCKQIKPNMLIELFKDLTYPQLILMALIRNMIRNKVTVLTFSNIITYYGQVKQYALVNLPGSSFNYKRDIFEKAFKRLIQLRLISIDDSNDTQQCAPITVIIFIQDVERIFIQIRSETSDFLRKILAYVK